MATQESLKKGGTRTKRRSAVRLVALDFDGTIMCYDPPPGFFHPAVIRVLNRLESLGIAWCTNSGRDFADQLRVIEASTQLGLRHRPVALLCSESLVYERQGGDYAPAEPWNSRALDGLKSLHQLVQARVMPHVAEITGRYGNCSHFVGEHYLAFNVENAGDLPRQLHEDLEERLCGIDGWRITRNGGWVAVIHASLGKGSILREIGTRLGIGPESILAVGDHLNDLPMFDGHAAFNVGCPGDSVVDVIQQVRMLRGHVAASPGPEGTVEVIEHFVSGKHIS